MIDLASYLVRDEVVSRRQMEQALKRQAIYGAGLDTALLELELVDEVKLAGYLARALGLGVGTPELLDDVEPMARRLVPPRLAIEKRVLPVRVEGSRLVVLVAPDVDLQELESLAFMLSLEMLALVIPEVRMHEALADHYRVPAPVRMVTLWKQLGPARIPSAVAVGATTIRDLTPPQVVRPRLQTLVGLGIPGAPPGADLLKELLDQAVAAEAAAAAAAAEVAPPGEHELLHRALAGTADQALPSADQPVVELDAGEPPVDEPIFTPPPLVHAIELAPRGDTLSGMEIPRAITRLTVAQHREQVVRALLGAAAAEVPFAAFLLHRRGQLRGVAAVAHDGTRIHLGGLEQVLSGPSLAAGVIQSQKPYVGPPWNYPSDELLLQQLGRAPVWLALLPVVLRRRVVALLYLDAVDQARIMSLASALGPVLDLAAEALARLVIKRRERGSGVPTPGTPTPVDQLSPVEPAAEAGPAPEVPPAPAAPMAPEPPPVQVIWAREPEAGRTILDLPIPSEETLPGAFRQPAPRSAAPAPEVPKVVEFTAEPAASQADDWSFDDTTSTGLGPRPLASVFDLGWSSSAGQGAAERPLMGADSLEEALSQAAEELRRSSPSRALPGLPDEDLSEPARPARPAPLVDPAPELAATTPALRPAASARAAMAAIRGDRPAPVTPSAPVPAAVTMDALEPPLAVGGPTAPSQSTQLLAWLEVLEGGGPDTEDAIRYLVAAGAQVLPFLSRRFPGRLVHDRFRLDPAKAAPPPPSEHGPILQLVSRMGRAANPMLLKLSGATDLDVRYYATVLLAGCAEPAVLPALAARIYDADPPTREAALRGLARLSDAPGIIPVLDRLRADLLGPDRVRQKYAIQGVAALRHGPAVPRLVELLEHKERGIVAAARRALVVLTRQDYGDSQRKWRAWWDRNREHHRMEWLIDALDSADPGVAQAASDELTLLTGEHFGFYSDLSRADREQAQKRWHEWWQAKGKKSFLV